MKAVPPGIWMAAAILFSVPMFIAPAAVNAQTGNSCDCSDIPYLIDQLGRSNAALMTLRQYEQTVGRNEVYNEVPPEANPNRWTRGEIVLNEIIKAMALAQIKPPPLTSARCVGSIEKHRGSIRKGMRDPMTLPLRTYIGETNMLYRLEIDEIMKIMKQLSSSCPPLDWFGTITVIETKEHGSVDRQPAKDRFFLGSETTQTDTFTRTGVIPVGRSDMITTWQFVGKLTRIEETSSMHDCDSRGGANFEDLRAFRTHRQGVTERAGSKPVEMEFSPGVSEDGRKFQINFRIPEVPVLADVEVSDIGVGGCPGEAFDRPESAKDIPSSVGVADVAFEGNIIPRSAGDPAKIAGSQTIDLVPPGFSVPGTTLKHTIRVTYNLYKLK